MIFIILSSFLFSQSINANNLDSQIEITNIEFYQESDKNDSDMEINITVANFGNHSVFDIKIQVSYNNNFIFSDFIDLKPNETSYVTFSHKMEENNVQKYEFNLNDTIFITRSFSVSPPPKVNSVSENISNFLSTPVSIILFLFLILIVILTIYHFKKKKSE
jgi:hypothetical protein